MTLTNGDAQKRTSTAANFSEPIVKRPQVRHVHHHELNWRAHVIEEHQLPSQEQEDVNALLTRSISLALESVGFEGAECLAIESFKAEVEECPAPFDLKLLALKELTDTRYGPFREKRPSIDGFLQT